MRFAIDFTTNTNQFLFTPAILFCPYVNPGSMFFPQYEQQRQQPSYSKRIQYINLNICMNCLHAYSIKQTSLNKPQQVTIGAAQRYNAWESKTAETLPTCYFTVNNTKKCEVKTTDLLMLQQHI